MGSATSNHAKGTSQSHRPRPRPKQGTHRPLQLKPKPSEKKGKLGTKVNLARTVVRELVGFAPYERRCMDLLQQGFDKRALKFCKKRLGTHSRGKRKRGEMETAIQQMKMK